MMFYDVSKWSCIDGENNGTKYCLKYKINTFVIEWDPLKVYALTCVAFITSTGVSTNNNVGGDVRQIQTQ